MFEKKRILELDEQELGILINALTEFRNFLLRKGQESDVVDDVILKVVYAPTKRLVFSRRIIEER